MSRKPTKNDTPSFGTYSGTDSQAPYQTKVLFWNDAVSQEMDLKVIYMNKGRLGMFMSLMFMPWTDIKQRRQQVTYKHIPDDQETYSLAVEITTTTCHFHPSLASAIGFPVPSGPLASLHLDSRQKPLWLTLSLHRKSRSSSLSLTKLKH